MPTYKWKKKRQKYRPKEQVGHRQGQEGQREESGKVGVIERALETEGGCSGRGGWEGKEGGRQKETERCGYRLSLSLIHPVGTIPMGLGSHRLDNSITLHEQVQGLRSTSYNSRGQAVGEEVGPRTLP